MSEHFPHFSPDRNQRTTGAGLDAISAGDDGTSRQTMIARLLLLLVLTWHSFAWTGDPALGPQDGQWLLHGVELGIHETGHLLFMPFGETLHILGGSLFQLVVPVVFAISFWRRGDRFSTAVCIWWLALGIWDVAIYVADARVQELELVGGGEHDWAMLLDQWDKLEGAERIGRVISRAGTLLAIVAIGYGGSISLRRQTKAE